MSVMPRTRIESTQWKKLKRLLKQTLSINPYWQQRIARIPKNLAEYRRTVPIISKQDLVADREQHPPYGSNLSYPLTQYTRYCQTSGTQGKPVPWIDTPQDWQSMLDCWVKIYEAAGVMPGADRLFFGFSFGPFLGFWTAWEAALRLGLFSMPGGALSTNARLDAMENNGATVLCCTPTYAIRLGEARAERQKNPPVRIIIVAGEPGGSIPATRSRIEALWPGARVFDHHGLTEIGPVAHEDPTQPFRLLVLEDYYFAEVIDPQTGREVEDREQGELILSTLVRAGCPLFRFRTGDLVVKAIQPDGTLALEGGILGRLDDMVVVRGVNVYPSAIEGVLRRFPQVVEYQVRENWVGGMLELALVVELLSEEPDAVATLIKQAFQDSLALRLTVDVFPLGSLPRFEFKARRWIKAPAQETAQFAPFTPM